MPQLLVIPSQTQGFVWWDNFMTSSVNLWAKPILQLFVILLLVYNQLNRKNDKIGPWYKFMFEVTLLQLSQNH